MLWLDAGRTHDNRRWGTHNSFVPLVGDTPKAPLIFKNKEGLPGRNLNGPHRDGNQNKPGSSLFLHGLQQIRWSAKKEGSSKSSDQPTTKSTWAGGRVLEERSLKKGGGAKTRTLKKGVRPSGKERQNSKSTRPRNSSLPTKRQRLLRLFKPPASLQREAVPTSSPP